jgi:hypothetical protein
MELIKRKLVEIRDNVWRRRDLEFKTTLEWRHVIEDLVPMKM